MRIEADSVLRHPRPRVFAAYRDHIQEAVGFLPNVREIEVVERREDGAKVRLHNVWRGGIELPEKLSNALATSRGAAIACSLSKWRKLFIVQKAASTGSSTRNSAMSPENTSAESFRRASRRRR